MAPSGPPGGGISLDVLFQTPEGTEEVKTFTQRPLGMEFIARMPITVNTARFHAAQLGVQRGWIIKGVGEGTFDSMDFPAAFRAFKEAVAPLREELSSTAWPPFSVPALMERVAPVKPKAVPAYLERYGYQAWSHVEWKAAVPQPDLRITLEGHQEEGHPQAHTWYLLRCELSERGQVSHSWTVQRRLAHVRACLHEPVKRGMGRSYNKLFAHAHFAHRSGPPGTSERLTLWLQALTWHIKDGAVPPGAAAATLRFLEAPGGGMEVGDGSPPTPTAAAAGETAETAAPAMAEAAAPEEAPVDQESTEVTREETLLGNLGREDTLLGTEDTLADSPKAEEAEVDPRDTLPEKTEPIEHDI